ncbi:MAG: PD-(D/E)XK nuclease family protein, partial [Opitutales bacterium]|nr:PD-(D/E)XK nuclease family protein [Opitutales bacterium]
PARDMDMGAIAAAFVEAGEPFAACARELAVLKNADVNGYLKGFIDLVFRRDGQYRILDWKSNWLGPDIGHYTPNAMHRAMCSHGYYLQGCIYALAFRRGMRQRVQGWDYERDFGGIHYVFLRGVSSGDAGSGVVSYFPPASLLDAMERALGCERGNV